MVWDRAGEINSSSDIQAWPTISRAQIRELQNEVERLRRSEALLMDAQNTAHMGTWEWDVNCPHVIWSKELYRIYGRNPEDFQPSFENYLSCLHPEDLERIKSIMQKVFLEHIPFSHDERILRPDKSIRYLHTWGHTILDNDGQLSRLIGVCLDITEQRLLEEKVHQSEVVRDRTFETVSDVLFYINVEENDFRFVLVNDAFLKSTGLKAEDVNGKMVKEIIPEPSRSLVLNKFKKIVADKKTQTWEEVTSFPSGIKYGEVTVTPVLNKKQECYALVGTVHDITERKIVELELQKAKKRLQFLADSSKTLVSSLDFETTLKNIISLYVPHIADRCLIELNEGHQTKKFSNLEGDDLEKFMQDLNQIPHTKIPLKLREKELGVFILSTTHEENMSLLEELTQRCAIALENAQLYHESLRSIALREDFISIAAHELRTPITALSLQLQLFPQILKDASFDKKDKLMKMLQSSSKQLTQFANLVDNLLDVSRISSGKLQLDVSNVQLNDLLHMVVDRYQAQANTYGSKINLSIKDNIIGCWDGSRLEQVLVNLIVNAIRYGGGKDIDIFAESDKRNLKIWVKDHGIGIGDEDRERIFRRFERVTPLSKYKGLGLGLFISREIAHAHGGDLTVESVLGQGSTFLLSLPLKH